MRLIHRARYIAHGQDEWQALSCVNAREFPLVLSSSLFALAYRRLKARAEVGERIFVDFYCARVGFQVALLEALT